jgi:hypothetical protein
MFGCLTFWLKANMVTVYEIRCSNMAKIFTLNTDSSFAPDFWKMPFFTCYDIFYLQYFPDSTDHYFTIELSDWIHRKLEFNKIV